MSGMACSPPQQSPRLQSLNSTNALIHHDHRRHHHQIVIITTTTTTITTIATTPSSSYRHHYYDDDNHHHHHHHHPPHHHHLHSILIPNIRRPPWASGQASASRGADLGLISAFTMNLFPGPTIPVLTLTLVPHEQPNHTSTDFNTGTPRTTQPYQY